MKKKLIAAFLLSSILAFVIIKCNPNDNSQSKTLEWNELKALIKKGDSIKNLDNKDIGNYYQINPNEVNEMIEIYNNKNSEVKLLILNILNQNLSEFKEINNFQNILNFYQNIAKSNDKNLSPTALVGLMSLEKGGHELWQNWRWSEQVITLLEEAVNHNLYNLSHLGDLQLLALANRYPDSLFTKGCKEYSKFTGGTYFGDTSMGILRQPFIPQREIDFWTIFVKKYPGHPSMNDALYRLARAYELQGDYENAVIRYYEASEAPADSLNEVASQRVLFIIDLLMSSELLTKFLTNHPNHPLVPHIKYSRAVHLIRESQYLLAESEINDFLHKYRDSRFFNLMPVYYGKYKAYLDSFFWEKVNEQLEQVKKLTTIRNQGKNDQTLYEEAKLWVDRNKKDDGFIAYNYLWGQGLRSTFNWFVPHRWEGNITYVQRLVNADFIKTANESYKSQISYLISIKLLQQLIQEYPQSPLVEKARYSIGLNYYYLWAREYPVFSDSTTSWKDMVIQSFEEFIKEFPHSSMADNADYTIKYVQKVDSSN